MTRAGCIGSLLAIVMILGGAANATSIGLAVGLDPTGILLVSALTEMPVSPDFDVRAEVGIATGDMAGLMLITASALAHHTFEPVDPFAGLGVGVALTPPPFSTGLVLEGVAGVRFVPLDALVVFGEVRYLVRWRNDGFTSGPVYEAGLEVRF
jgi:hypothetical protein